MRVVATAARDADCGRPMIGALSLTVTVSYGILMYAFPVLLGAMQAELGWSQALLTGGFSVAALTAGITAILVGRVVDRDGPRAVMVPGTAAATVLLLAWSTVRGPIGYYAVWIGLGACMAAVFYEPAFAAVTHWPREHRARALTVITVAGGLASPIFVPLTTWLLGVAGWRMTIVWLAAILSVLVPVSYTFLPRTRAAHPGSACRRASGGPADAEPVVRVIAPTEFSTAKLRWLAASCFLSTATNVAVAIHIVPLLLARGSSPGYAGAALAALGLAKLPGRLLLAPASRALPMRKVAVLLLVVQLAGLIGISMVPDAIGVCLFAALFGAADGASTPARADLVAELHGTTAYGRISGVLAFVMAMARAAAPLGVSLACSGAGGYDSALRMLAGATAAAAIALARATRSHAARDPIGQRSRDPIAHRLRPFGAMSVCLCRNERHHEHEGVGS